MPYAWAIRACAFSTDFLKICICIQITVIGDECLRKFECRYATEKATGQASILVWALPSAIRTLE